MIFAANEIVGGLPAKSARDFMRASRFSNIEGAAAVADFCNITLLKTQAFLDFCLSKQWLTPEVTPDVYALTPLGGQVSAARIGKAIPRAKAEELVAKVTQRAHEWNILPDVPLAIEEIRVFGSYLSDAPLLGDVNLSVLFKRRPGDERLEFAQTRALVQKLVSSQGWAMPTDFFGVISFWEVGMYRYLKARQPTLSFTGCFELKAINCPYETVFQASA